MISVIVPVYNVEKYLHKCVDSIINQTYKDLEIILVDDGSPDNCPKICDEYAQKDNRIKVIHKENGGVSSARNVGLISAQGEFVQFIDSDDFIKEQMIEKLISSLHETSSDIVVCRAITYYDSGKEKIQKNDKWEEVLNRDDAAKLIFSEMNNAMWNKLFKKELAEGILFEEGRTFGEDPYFLAQILNKSKKVSFVSEELYYYRQRENSITSGKFSEKRFDQVYFKDKMYDYFTENFSQIVHLAERWRFVARLNICRNIFSAKKEKEYKGVVCDYRNFLKSNYKKVRSLLKSKEIIEYSVFKLGGGIYKIFIKAFKL